MSATRSPGEVRFGVQLGRGRPDSLRTLAERIEALGFDSIWVGDHLLYRDDGRPDRDRFVDGPHLV